MSQKIVTALSFGGMIALHPMAVFADVTAEQLWAHWNNPSNDGVSIAAGQVDTSTDGMTLTDVTLSFSVEDTGATATLGGMTLTNQSNGSVLVTLPDTTPVNVTLTPSDAPVTEAAATLNSTEFVLTLSGTAEQPDLDLGAVLMALTVDSVTQEGEPLDASFALNFGDVTGTLTGLTSDLSAPADLTLDVGEYGLDMAMTDPDSSAEISSQSQFANFAFNAHIEAIDPDIFLPVLQGKMTFGSGQSSTTTTVPEIGTMSSSASSQSAEAQIAITEARATYEGTAQGLEMSFTDPRIPVGTVGGQAEAIDFMLSLPAAPADDLQRADLVFDLNGLTLDDSVWSTFDSDAALPRDPANLRLALEADMEFTSLAMLEQPSPELPIRNLRITDLHLSFAGVEADATGSFMLPETPMSPEGIPNTPAGSIEARATGVIGLLGKLGEAGLVDPEQLMGAQMMLGMFATFGENDTLTSKIETAEDGSVLINGTQIK
ncbi:DUF2125 domain-containing protein [Qingshengfaniella alkalisoli]|uniref:DUF2125 domain-containing protein n=1 Tax=Qingshengfaniella alkalisoli TaxID=2599296 RepID=A0A5B8IU57_9RHOB|nr:DUF2125 domain-containing protein [Qingshengfaniella alkalisoli]QDY68381.1 DUF2125 domain-containing protein [Qingshengfaniella alkalisoli]